MNIIHWFRQDLRLSDNPALHTALSNGNVLPIYIVDSENAGSYTQGAASKLWLHHSLQALNHSLQSTLCVYSGSPLTILSQLIKKHRIDAIYWNRCYEPWQIKRDTLIKATLAKQGIQVKTFNGTLLWEPWEVLKKDGTPYRIFTPYYRQATSQPLQNRLPLPTVKLDNVIPTDKTQAIDSLDLLTGHPWEQQAIHHWTPGEQAANKQLKQFLKHKLRDYKQGRDFPALDSVSRLSPYLHFGELSPIQIRHYLKPYSKTENTEHFIRELAWREFSYYLLYHFPTLPKKNLQSKFDAFPWLNNKKPLHAWQRGVTGYPFIDAGMRELWQTGYMHNRVRMIVASFLVKNLRIHWREGERWFRDCLFDADLANNSASWQWVAGCGTDAAPYFRIFNPVTQAKKFDPEGEYIKRYLPELRQLPVRYLFQPWEAPESILKEAGVKLGITYPKPIVDLTSSRKSALSAYQAISHS